MYAPRSDTRRLPRATYGAAIGLLVTLICCLEAAAFVTEHIGPLPDSPEMSDWRGQSWWPSGIVELAKHPGRVYSKEHDTVERVYFDASDTQIRELILLFGRVVARELFLEIETGSPEVRTLDQHPIEYSVRLEIPYTPLAAIDSTDSGWPEPRLVVYLTDRSDLSPDDIGPSLAVHSSHSRFAPLSTLPTARSRYIGTLPERLRTYREGTPIRNSYWVFLRRETDVRLLPAGIARNDGEFRVWLSEAERALLDRGELSLCAARNIYPGPSDTIIQLDID